MALGQPVLIRETLGIVEEPSPRLLADEFGFGNTEFPGVRLVRLIVRRLEVVLLASHADMMAINRQAR